MHIYAPPASARCFSKESNVRTRGAKLLPIYLPADEYAELRRKARAEERDPIQQARWMLRGALARQPDDPTPSRTPSARGISVPRREGDSEAQIQPAPSSLAADSSPVENPRLDDIKHDSCFSLVGDMTDAAPPTYAGVELTQFERDTLAVCARLERDQLAGPCARLLLSLLLQQLEKPLGKHENQ